MRGDSVGERRITNNSCAKIVSWSVLKSINRGRPSVRAAMNSSTFAQGSRRFSACSLFKFLMAIVSVNLDWARRMREIRGGRIELPKRPTHVAHKVKWDLENFVCCLSTSVIDVSEFGKERNMEKGCLERRLMCVCRRYEDKSRQIGRFRRCAMSSRGLH